MKPGGINIQKKQDTKAEYFKDTLRQIPVGTSVVLDHKKYYCNGWGQRCTLAHYASLLKRRGEGEWTIKHTERGMAEVTRVR